MSLAERLYYNNRPKQNRNNETNEERAYRLARTYDRLFFGIKNVTDAKTYIQMRNMINAYGEEVGRGSIDVTRLTDKLNDRVRELEVELNDRIRDLNTEIEEIKSQRLEEPIERLNELNTQAEHRILQILMTLQGNNDKGAGDRRRIGNYVKLADRPQAIALMRIASMPQYSNLFTTKQKEIIVERSKNPAEVTFEKNKEALLAEKGALLGKAYLKAMNLRNALKKIGNEEKAHYFVDNAENAEEG